MATIEEQQTQIAAFRSSFRGRRILPMLQTQKKSVQGRPVQGPVWVAQDEFRVGEEHPVRDSLFEAIQLAAVRPIVLPVRHETSSLDIHVEWIGQRLHAAQDACLPPELSNADIFHKLQSDMEHDLTILFAHGGAFYSGSSASSRATTTKLARLSKARVISIDYRLAPQTQFPGQLLDLILVYLTLLYPPATSQHSAVPPANIVLAGESSGGGLCLSFIQFILHLRRMQNSTDPIVRFGGCNVTLPMPAGVAVHSAEGDRSLGLASWKNKGDIDILQEIQPANSSTQPSDSVWPSDPPRHDVYCHSSAYIHPISNPCTAISWQGSPPMWLAYGEERCLDAGKMIASMAAAQNVVVNFSEYAGMPHIFGVTFPHFRQSQACMADWAATCCAMVEKKYHHTCAKRVWSNSQPGDSVMEVDVKSLLPYTRKQAMEMIIRATNARELYIGELKSKSHL